jgi:ferritin-like metal-binding protein YciE
MKIENLQDLFVHTLQDIYFAEQTIVKKLPKMAEKAASSELKSGFEKHLAETKEHVKRLEQVFAGLGEKPKAERCPAIEGITEEAEELVKEIKDAETRDAAMLAAAQAVEHYEITRYGTLIAWAEQLGLSEAVPLLGKTLAEEKATDEKLTRLAEKRLNRRAAA